ncbi:MAG TPA: hypothetical protein VFY06_01850 [Verrucomicrobiae bacterium]|nr:hypothetical protein [Verrucomicrobiae bacterium]
MNGIKLFIRIASAVLLMAALNRFLIAAGNEPALALREPAVGIPVRFAVLLVGGIELVAALFCLFGRWPWLQLGALALLATGYTVYFSVLFSKGIQPQGSCIGSLTDPLRVFHGTVGYVFQCLPFGLALGSYAAAVALWLSTGTRTAQPAETRGPNDSLKMTCVLCGGHIEFPPQAVGQKISCPHCAKTITLLKPA